MTELDDLPSTYPGAADLTRQLDQEKIQLLTERVNSLRKENDELRQKLSIGEKDAHDFVAFFQKEMESKEETMTKLTEDVALKEQKIEEELRFMRASTAKEVADVSAAAIAKEQQLSMQITSLKTELSSLENYREMRKSHDSELESLKSRLKEQEQKYEAELTQLEHRYIAEKRTMMQEMSQAAETMRDTAKRGANSTLNAEIMRIQSEHKAMSEELRLQLKTTTELEAENKNILENTRALKRELNVLREREAEAAKISKGRAKQIQMLEDHIEVLIAGLEAESSDKHAERKQLEEEAERQMHEAVLDAEGLRQLLAMKNRELRHMKHLAQYILDQRSEVEAFFLQALSEVKEKIRGEKIAQHRQAISEYHTKLRQANECKGPFPDIKAPATLRDYAKLGQGTQQSKIPAGAMPNRKVQLHELSWEDKEKILRLLFAKINHVQKSVDQMPEHTLALSSPASSSLQRKDMRTQK